MKLFDLGDRLTGIKDVLCRVAIMLDSNLDDKVEWNGNFSREVSFLRFPKIPRRAERGRMRINDLVQIFPLLVLKGNFLVLLKCAVQLPEDRSLTEKRQRNNIWNQLVWEFIAIYSCKEHYANEGTIS